MSTMKIVQASVPRTTTLYINNAKPPLNDVRVRQAIQSAIDVKSLTNDALEGTVIPAIGPFAPSEPFAPPGAQPAPYDLAKAQSLLAEAGIDPKTVTLGLWAYPGRPDLPTVAVAIQAMLKKLGLTIEVRLADYNSLEPEALAGNFDMMIVSRGHLADVNDPLAFMLADYGCKGAYQMSHYCDAGVDEQLAKAGTLSDTTQRYAIYREIAAKMQAEAVDVYLYHETEINVQSTRVQGFKIHRLHNYVLTPELTLQPK